MSIVATVPEGALALALVEKSAWDTLEDLLVLLDQIVFLGATLYQMIRGNDQVAVSTTDGTGAVVILGCALVVSGTPIPDTLQAEGVVATIQHTELSAMLEHLLKTDAALLV